MTGVSVIVLNYNGRHLLAESLPLTMRALAGETIPWEVLVVDNGSSDDSIAFVQAQFPTVRIVGIAGNARFMAGNNIGVTCARYPLVMLLNNDMYLEPGCLAALQAHFADKNVFAVDSRIVDWETGELIEGAKALAFRDGWFAIVSPSAGPGGASPTLYATGGGAMFDREKFLALGGFDWLYYPFYAEDFDLSYCAWKAGYTVRHEPRAVTRHRLRATNTKLFKESYRRRALLKNYWLWYWKCIDDQRLLANHLLHLPWLAARQTMSEGTNALLALGWALLDLPRALAGRRAMRRTVADTAIAAAVGGSAR